MKSLNEISVGFSSDPQLGKLKNEIEINKIFIRHIGIKPIQHFASYFSYALATIAKGIHEPTQERPFRNLQIHASNLSKQTSQIENVLTRFKGDKFAQDLKRDQTYYIKALELVDKYQILHSTLELFLHESSRMTFEVLKTHIKEIVELFFKCLVLQNDLGGFEGLALMVVHVRGMQKDLKGLESLE